MRRAEITLSGTGEGRIVLDGQDVSSGIRGLVLTGSVHEPPHLTLDLPIVENTAVTGEVKVHIREETRELLIQLGWTPPNS